MNALIEHLRGHGERVAVLTETAQLTYRELADRVAEAARALGSPRRLVLLETRNDISTLVHYLGAMAAGHVVLAVPAGRDHAALDEIYAPDVVIDDRGVHHRHHDGRPLHDDLALLMSTSGSTGSPKLVRLSHANLVANAMVIAEYLGISETDRAATTLPMSYCYGLSVIHSHLLVGAGLILTDHSVVDEQFWNLFRRHRGTSFAGVPYTFELLERVGFDAADLPHLRYVTQAGGRMPPERVRRFAELAQRSGFDLFVMYGATEATARMSYLPPELALSRPDAIGRPIRGGSFSIEPLDGWADDDVGELVYRGPNVMMGYAHGPDDLALGKTVETLRTGDIARRAPDGLYEVVGRNSRFVKMYGLRIDLQQVEAALRAAGMSAFCTNEDDRLVVAAAGRHDDRDVQRAAADAAGVPAGAVHAVTVDELPLLSSGKPDYQTVRRLARTADRPHVLRPVGVVRRCAPGRRRLHRPRCQLRRPRRQFAVLRDDDGAVGTGDRPAAPGLAADVDSAAGANLEAGAPQLARDPGDQRRSSRRRDRAHRRIPRRTVRTVGRRTPVARHRRLQLRPVLPHAGHAHRPGAPSR